VNPIPAFADPDRLGLSFFGSALFHLVVLLGVGFAAPRIVPPSADTLEITLVQASTKRAPKDADYLAQANADGGGNVRDRKKASSPLPVLELGMSRGLPELRARKSVAQAPNQKEEVLTADSKRRIGGERKTPDPLATPARSAPGDAPQDQRTVTRAQLTAALDQSWQELQSMPRHKYVSARTREYRYAKYMDAWRAKVERIGNLNYPAEARVRGISGSLVLDVAIARDGNVKEITLVRPAEIVMLNEAATRIVQLASPFEPFPPGIRSDTDVLHITRTWRFGESGLTSEME
jgi:protein TonB